MATIPVVHKEVTLFNPFNYKLEELKAMLVQLVLGGAAIAVLLFAIDPGIGPAIATVVVTLFGVIAVFAAKNIDADEAMKSIMALLVAGINVAVLLGGGGNTDTREKVAVIALPLIVPVVIKIITNARGISEASKQSLALSRG